MNVTICWMRIRDHSEVLEIEQASFDHAWMEDDLRCCLRQRNCIPIVAKHNHDIVGFMIYELCKSKLRIVNFAVAPSARRQGVATQMVRWLVDKLSQQRRKEIILEVRETNLMAQKFFRSKGFRAVCVLRNHYDDVPGDAYEMVYRLAEADDWKLPFSPHNRITQYAETTEPF